MNARQAFRRFSPAVRGEGRRFVVAGTLLGLAAACEVFAVFVLADVIDGALNSDSFTTFARLALIWLLITAISCGGDYAGQVVSVGISERVVLRLRDRLFDHVQRLHPVQHRRLGLGNLVTRHTGDLEAVEYLIGTGVMQFVIAAAHTIGLVIAALIMSWQVALVALAAVPALWGLSAFFARRQERVTRDERGANSDIADSVETALAGHETAVAYNQQGREHARLHANGVAWMGARLAQTRVEAGLGGILSFGQVVVTLAIAVVGVWQVRQGQLSVGGLLALTGYLGMLYPKMQELADIRIAIASALISAERVAEILDIVPVERVDAGSTAPSATLRSPRRPTTPVGISLCDVTLAREHQTILDDVSLHLAPGTVTALIGPSGVGKSTLASLLCRFEHPDSGTLCIGDMDYDDLTGHWIRDHITLLPQQPIIKGATVADNIAYGRPDATRAEIVAAAIAADADEFVSRLPDGYDARLDDGGLTLSGGQRQRIAIARAMLRNTPALILDEPTSGLDAATTTRILDPLRRLADGRTTLLITHDSRVTAIADRVLELRDGHLLDMTYPDEHAGRSGTPPQITDGMHPVA
ncbi:ABC transporter ATP-binding protein [Gordonia aichiensis]|uniref:Putative ABC transporter permease/ATP-binding protein n=1 Tax=Gordonia aichiensis NBRC 108223 TaxID=1220583 RepID=L7KQI6_9ACTN|nr:ABC transporter ATP-binding protein [Gordonia aichiensis]GAC50222.1 putative ABC transporter permease/ATP-binding protein [Gordonia aichiensis NBRC 108223]